MLLGTYRKTSGNVPNDRSQALIFAPLGIIMHVSPMKTKSVI